MSMTRPTLIGVFDEPTMADNAVNALTDAGFDTDSIYNSGHSASSGFFAELKRLFSGEDTNTAADLKDLGLTSEEANYYQNEHRAGRRIVAVNASGREQEALSVLQGLGGRIYGTQNAAAQSTQDPNAAYANNAGTYQNDANAYQNDTAATAGNYQNDRTAAGNYQNDNAAGNYQNDRTAAGNYQNDNAAGTYQNDRTAAGNYQNDNVANAGTYQNDRTAAGNYQNDRAYNNNNTTADGYPVQDNQRVGETTRREEARMERQEDMAGRERSRERFDSERNQDNNNY